MLLANYASDSEGSDTEVTPGPSVSAAAPVIPPPKPTTTAAAPAQSKPKKRGGPVKITLDLPKATSKGDGDGDDAGGGDEADEDEGREAKKPRVGGLKGGKGSSLLLGMLPPPKRKLPTTSSSSSSGLAVNRSMAAKPAPPRAPLSATAKDDDDSDDEEVGPAKSGLLLPSSIARAKAKASTSEPEIDLFGLSSAPSSSSSRTLTSSSAAAAAAAPPPLEISSAPPVADFQPPPPTLNDPYPGYYQLPSGSWAAYDPDYYHSFFPSSAGNGNEAEEQDDGRVGKHWKDFESGQRGDIVEVSAADGILEAQREEERRKKVQRRGANLLGNDFQYKEIGQVKGLAAQRHQLTSLLSTAYSQREELEDRIAHNKKNARMAGTKYGF